MYHLKMIGWAGNIKSLQKPGLQFIDQLYDMHSAIILIQQQVKRLREEDTKRRKATWFQQLEETIMKTDSRVIKNTYTNS